MFNTLKEMQETLSYDDLCKYANESLGKSSEEIKELLKSYGVEVSDSTANECYEFIKGIDVVSDEELENVAGGSCYSSETFESLGLEPCYRYPLNKNYHPLITTYGNSCKLIDGAETCSYCWWLSKEAGNMASYCRCRSKECDPAK